LFCACRAGSLTPKPGIRLSLNPAVLLAAPASLLGLLKLAWGWLQVRFEYLFNVRDVWHRICAKSAT
jgi:hypothetical protein